ncbi:hypothetical protein GQF56_06015 [Rhodobacter sphaeroides]|jgi:hypothetical protein|uniref:NYN domain-containing protein n=1 Tax=Cereibacter sphaeroides (strain ATCC 17023 / DSM 158 / JCM 6121 / CCUG 31486 / LMG 2827 / NBRC 12203 / NCIMB 8253 / ATH 2.4.1.) TaxID=272943 RepID=Q3J1E2_CERS4|nr:hypothetical protein [Cereibacter sphaeroides]ABA79392.1 hypothetical protein RSP_6103 [Cereibacter sphaeroides 2.4.1]AMJ47690.1 hypothetical protein APX01_09120 [Cereibacter sphaeroides]ANS34400.1 hypothetical protein A3858_09145 [Cereibacter sphaeroides]ATN63446.1 hypothetical protein A3857_09140 [Cereibacter sphaeroides]AXC61608.1 hypothetical protein DQL45_09600 [Cereibacter sphaeroides 2.4.1]
MTITFRTPHRIPSPRVAPSTRPRGLTPVTGPIPDTLTGRILLLVDAENLVLSARDLDVALDFEALRAAFARYDRRQVECHAVYSQDIGDGPLAVHLVRRGWHPTPRPPIQRLPADRGHRNADNWFVFVAARSLRSVGKEEDVPTARRNGRYRSGTHYATVG